MLVCKNMRVSVPSKSSGSKVLFNDLSFEARAGEILMVLGKNGTGKSTLLKTLVGQIKPEFGTISLFESELSQVPQKQRAKRFAFVMQDNERGTIQNFTVLENLCFALNKGQKLSFLRAAVSKAKEEKIRELLATHAPSFLEYLAQNASSLSGGQRQLLSILMNVISDAEVFLLDEPTAALDDATTEDVMSQIRYWVRERKLIAIMVCHDLSLVERFADRKLEIV